MSTTQNATPTPTLTAPSPIVGGTDYYTCTSDGRGKCSNPFHQNGKVHRVREGSCRIGRALIGAGTLRKAAQCGLCLGHIPEGKGFGLAQSSRAKLLNGMLIKDDRTFFVTTPSGGTPVAFCDHCAPTAQDNLGENLIPRRAPLSASAQVAEVVRLIQARGYILNEERSGPPKMSESGLLTRCTIMAARGEAACQCGGWHKIAEMFGFSVSEKSGRAVAFLGQACAAAAQKEGVTLLVGNGQEILERVLGRAVVTTPSHPAQSRPEITAGGICQAIAAGKYVKFAPREQGRDGAWRNGCAASANGATCCGGEPKLTADMWAMTRRSADGDLQIFTICGAAADAAASAGLEVAEASQAFAQLATTPHRTGGGGQDLRRQFSFDTVAPGVGERTRSRPGKPGGQRGPSPEGPKKAGRKCKKQK